MLALVAPVRRHGFDMYRAWIADNAGRVVWSAVRWSEESARQEAIKAMQNFLPKK